MYIFLFPRVRKFTLRGAVPWIKKIFLIKAGYGTTY
jgi:hypothetical protein